MTPLEFEHVRDMVRRECGLVLDSDKTYLAESRLVPVARKWQASSVEQLVDSMRNGIQPDMTRDVVDAMVSSDTHFFRDRAPFDHMGTTALPMLAKARRRQGRPIRIWSAGCSTGQEAYSVSMTVSEILPSLGGAAVEIVATDVSAQAIERAKAGRYSQFEVQHGLPVRMLARHFVQDRDDWCVTDDLKRRISFRTFNLIDDLAALGSFDIVLCRNVLGSFDPSMKTRVLDRMAGALTEDGYLYLGHGETTLGMTALLKPSSEGHGVHRPKHSYAAPIAAVSAA